MPVAPRLAGALYLLIIVCGIAAEVFLRTPLRETAFFGPDEVAQVRLSVLADLTMALADVAVALMLFALLRPLGPWLAATASLFRLVQAAGILAGLAWLLAAAGQPAQAQGLLAVHSAGYDLSLTFFAVTCIATGLLLLRAGLRWLGIGLIASGVIYAIGSVLRVVAPGLAAGFEPAYVLPLVTELAFALWLLSGARAPRLHEKGPIAGSGLSDF